MNHTRAGAHVEKSIGSYAFNIMTKTMSVIIVAMVLDQATNMDNFKACVLGPKKPRHWRNHDGLIQAYFRNVGAQSASSAQTHVGSVHAGDIIALRCPSGDVAVDW